MEMATKQNISAIAILFFFYYYYFLYTFYDLRVKTLHAHPVTNCQSQDGLTLNQYI